MGWSFPILTVRGTVLRLHVTFVLFLVWIGVIHYVQGGLEAGLQGVLFISLLFLCVVLHEFGHVFAARRYGVRTPEIILLPIGGVARLERIPEKPSQELVVALAGPAVNVVIAALLYLVLGGFRVEDGVEVQNPSVDLLTRLATVNVFLVLFNLVPAFPMDGGRVLRAFLAHRMGYARGTQVAASVGQAVAFGLGLLGLFYNPLLILIALFVYLGAASEANAVQLREASRGMIVADTMITRFERLSLASRVDDAVECLIRTTQHDFPVVDQAGRLAGVLSRDDIIRALRERGPDTPAVEAMRKDIPIIGHRRPLDEALRLMQAGSLPAIGVENEGGMLVGLINTEQVGELMMIQAARPQRRFGRPGPWQSGLRPR